MHPCSVCRRHAGPGPLRTVSLEQQPERRCAHTGQAQCRAPPQPASCRGHPPIHAGAVSSAFFAGYMVTNLCGGFLATRYSAKGVLALGVVLWSLFTIATPAAAGGNLNQLLLAR